MYNLVIKADDREQVQYIREIMVDMVKWALGLLKGDLGK